MYKRRRGYIRCACEHRGGGVVCIPSMQACNPTPWNAGFEKQKNQPDEQVNPQSPRDKMRGCQKKKNAKRKSLKAPPVVNRFFPPNIQGKAGQVRPCHVMSNSSRKSESRTKGKNRGYKNVSCRIVSNRIVSCWKGNAIQCNTMQYKAKQDASIHSTPSFALKQLPYFFVETGWILSDLVVCGGGLIRVAETVCNALNDLAE
jgi:hypothetical protein